jgi:diamine N-acetyltransferase
MADGPQFRVAEASDAELLLDFVQAYYAFDGHGYDREKARAALIALLQNPSFGRAWLILDGDSPIGYAVLCFGYSLEWLGRDAFVDEFYLREEYRGCGWGRAAMAFIENEARRVGIRVLHLEVVQQNARALELYRGLGFREHHSTFLSKWIDPESSKPPRTDGH